MSLWHDSLSVSLVFFPLLQEVLVTATVVLKHIASKISDSQDDPPSVWLFWLLLQNWLYIDMFCYHVYLWVMIVVPSPYIINQHAEACRYYSQIFLQCSLFMINFVAKTNTKLQMLVYCHWEM